MIARGKSDMSPLHQPGPAAAQAGGEWASREWRPVPGMPGAFAYPYIRRSDVLSCNSYLLEFPGGFALIDPGALPRQTAELRALLAARNGERRPMGVFLTHCHFDHSRETSDWLSRPDAAVWLAAQEDGARALAESDIRTTAAELYGMEIPAVTARMPLLTAEDLRMLRPRCVSLADGMDVEIRTEGEAVRQILDFGGARIEVIPCAGHSPDSVCYRFGECLFIGDLLLAHKPLVAGICGWDNRRLTSSLDRMIELLEGGSVAWCLPGHGNPLPAGKTLELLKRQRARAADYDDVVVMNADRMFQAVDVALELIDEGEEVFAAIAGRLLYVADRLEMLEEPEMARRCREAMDMDAVDALLEALRNQCRVFSAGSILPVAFAIEATGIVDRLRRIFPSGELISVLPASLVNRAERLLLDFIGVAQGTRNLEEFMPTELGELLSGVEAAWRDDPHQADTWAARVDDPNGFAEELARRIGHPPRSTRIPVRFASCGEIPVNPAAALRFCDTMIQFLEWLSLAGATCVDVEAGIEAGRASVVVRPGGGLPDDSARGRSKRRSFARRFALAGFELTAEVGGFRLTHVKRAGT